jgi:hypothetical protein
MPKVPTEAMSGDTKSKTQKQFAVTEHREAHENRHTNA